MSVPAEQIQPANPAADPAPAPASAPAPAAPADRRAALSAALDARSAPAESAPAKAPPGAAPGASAPKPAEQPRASDGKFAPKSEAPAAPAAPVTDAAPAEPAKPARKMPASWKRDLEPVFGKLAQNDEFAAVLDEIERRESDYHRGIEQYKGAAEFAREMQAAIRPFEATMASINMAPQQAVRELLALDHTLRYGSPGDRARVVQSIAQRYSIDLKALETEAAAHPPAPPALTAIEQKLAAIENAQRRTQVEAINREIAAFAQGKEFFDEVNDDMAALIQAGRAADLNTAYEMAVWARPETREKLLAKQRAEAQAEARKAEAAAQSAASSVAGAPSGASSAAASPKDRRALIASLMDR